MGMGDMREMFMVPAEASQRCVYLGNIHPEASYKEVFDVLKGLILNLKIIPEKKCAFANFVDPAEADAFVRYGASIDLNVHGNRIKVGWGKPSPLTGELQSALSAGVTRNIYIGRIDSNFPEQQLLKELASFGHVEKIDFLKEKNIGFIHMDSVQNAMKAVLALRQDPNWSQYRWNYGKDRCTRM